MQPTYPPFPVCEGTGFEVVFESISTLKKKLKVTILIILRDVKAKILIAVIYRPLNMFQLSVISRRCWIWMHRGLRKVDSQFLINVSNAFKRLESLETSQTQKKKKKGQVFPMATGMIYFSA